MADIGKPVPVEGIYSNKTAWQHVMLCGDCLRVVAITTPPMLISTTENRYSWSWDGPEPSWLCKWCGFRFTSDTHTHDHRWTGFYKAIARWHSMFVWYNPYTWRTGYWEVRDFEKYMQMEKS